MHVFHPDLATMHRFAVSTAPLVAALFLALPGKLSAKTEASSVSSEQIVRTMRRATEFMVENVSREGGYVWSYLPDFSRRWGELEARPSQVWVQPPGTASMGHLFLDAYHATGDEYYYRAAERVGSALARGQHRSGGWDYLIDFDGEKSLRDWYGTVGRQAWRLEEFHHYFDNATFDDGGTAESARFFLRLYWEKKDARYREPLERVLSFVLESQYGVGGWPQRHPAPAEKPDHYSTYITFNDDVAGENIDFLLLHYQAFGEAKVKEAILRAMNAFVVTQGKPPQAGWALQYTLDLEPARARTYEPRAYATHVTAANIEQLFRFFEITGEKRFLEGVPAALDWLESVKLGPELISFAQGRTHPTFVEVGTNRPMFLHRVGSNVQNGRYYADHEPSRTIGHYSSFRSIDTDRLRAKLAVLQRLDPEALRSRSPLVFPGREGWLPRYVMTRPQPGSDLNAQASAAQGARESQRAAALVRALNSRGYWPVLLHHTSHPYRENAGIAGAAEDYSNKRVGDESDTSPYPADLPVKGISTAAYIRNMAILISALRGEE